MTMRNVTRQQLDQKTAEALVAVREAFRKVETVNEFLNNNPSNAPGGDPLTRSTDLVNNMDPNSALGKFGYTADEAYLLRVTFENLMQFGVKAILKDGRKLTGLE